MTFLVGYQTASSPTDTSPQSSGNDAFWNNAGHVAAATGTATSVNFYVPSWAGGATGMKICVYDNGGTLLGVSSVFAPADGTGLLNKSITLSGNITSGQTYKLVGTTTGGFVDARVDLATAITRAIVASGSFSYASPPASLPAPSTGAYFDWIVWLDGTVGGGSNNQKLTLLGVG